MSYKALIISLRGAKLSRDEMAILSKEKPWGVILFKRNLKSFNQIKKLTMSIKKLTKNKRFPILIEEFKLIDSAGFSDELFQRSDIHGKLSGKRDSEKPFQPIFVLEV